MTEIAKLKCKQAHIITAAGRYWQEDEAAMRALHLIDAAIFAIRFNLDHKE